MNTCFASRVLAAVCMLAVGSPAGAQDKSWKGEQVIYTKPAEEITFGDLIDGKQVNFSFSGVMPITVREEFQGRIRIHDGQREGWAEKGQFVLVSEAPAYFHRRVQANPADTWALYMRGAAWFRNGEPDNAIKDFDECIRLDPTNAAAFNSRGLSWYSKKSYDKAIRDYDEAIRLDPVNAIAFNNRGLAWSAKKDYDKAIRDHDEAIRLDANDGKAFTSRGRAWSAKKDYDMAIRDYDEAIRLDPKDAETFISRGFAWSNKKGYDKAIRDYDEAIRLNPKGTWAYFVRGLAWSSKKHYEKAITDFDEVTRLDPKMAYASILGHFAARAAKKDAVAKRFLTDSAAKLDQKEWPFSVIRFLRAEIDEAALLKLATDDDKRTEAHCYLGLDHMLKDHKKEAVEHFHLVKEHGNTSFVEYTIAVTELERLERGEN
jgi:tetratricopeptide (TPR) repeat protein